MDHIHVYGPHKKFCSTKSHRDEVGWPTRRCISSPPLKKKLARKSQTSVRNACSVCKRHSRRVAEGKVEEADRGVQAWATAARARFLRHRRRCHVAWHPCVRLARGVARARCSVFFCVEKTLFRAVATWQYAAKAASQQRRQTRVVRICETAANTTWGLVHVCIGALGDNTNRHTTTPKQ